MVVDTLLLIGSLIIILAGAELFTNGIEWVGHKLNFAEGAVGSVLAAVGTALPETLLPIVAILAPGASGHGHEIGVGAILGAPFMLATLAMFVTGIGVLYFTARGRRVARMGVNTKVLGRDITFFLGMYPIAALLIFVPAEFQWVKYLVSALLIVAYIVYVYLHMRESPEGDNRELPPRCYLERRHPVPRLRVATFQVFLGLGAIVVGANLFVGAISDASAMIGISSAILALVIAPVATELPEKFNSVLWVRQRKDTLALGNLTGAMVFQSAIPTAVGIAFTPWNLTVADSRVFMSAAVAVISTLFIFVPMMVRKKLNGYMLLVGGIFYAAFLVYLLV